MGALSFPVIAVHTNFLMNIFLMTYLFAFLPFLTLTILFQETIYHCLTIKMAEEKRLHKVWKFHTATPSVGSSTKTIKKREIRIWLLSASFESRPCVGKQFSHSSSIIFFVALQLSPVFCFCFLPFPFFKMSSDFHFWILLGLNVNKSLPTYAQSYHFSKAMNANFGKH